MSCWAHVSSFLCVCFLLARGFSSPFNLHSNLSAPFKIIPRARRSPLTLALTECIFLGPSRKRGPPKGYIDAYTKRKRSLKYS